MTATLNGRQVDVATVLKRVDERLAKRAGDDPLPAETIDAFAEAMQRQIIDPLTADGPRDLVIDTSDRGDIEQLRAQLAEANGKASRLTAEIDGLRKQLAERNGELNEARAELDTAKKAAENWQGESEKQTVALAEAKRAQTEHEHRYLWREPGENPRPCACGKPWPRHLVEVDEDEPAPEPTPWDQLLDNVRVQLTGWPEEA